MQTFAKTHTAAVILHIKDEVLATRFPLRSAADPCDYQCHLLVPKRTEIQPCRNGRMKKHQSAHSSLLSFCCSLYSFRNSYLIKKLNILVAIKE